MDEGKGTARIEAQSLEREGIKDGTGSMIQSHEAGKDDASSSDVHYNAHSKVENAADSIEDVAKSEEAHEDMISPVSDTEGKHNKDEGHDIELTESNIKVPAVQVPRAQRRGLFGRFTLVTEVENPKCYKSSIKWFITFVVALAAVTAPMASGIIFPCLSDISKDFHTTPTVTNLSAAFYMLAMGVAPLWWSSFSEILGRRTIYVISFTLFVVWNILAAVSVNIAMFIVMRILSGGAAASVQAVGAGTIADIWEPRDRGQAMGIFYIGPLCGPLIAPIIGGVLAEKLGWRSTQWFLAIYGAAVVAFIFFALPETLPANSKLPPVPTAPPESLTCTPTLSRISTRQSLKKETSRLFRYLRYSLIDPLKIVLLLRYPPVAITVYYVSITFAALYMLNISLEVSFSAPPYNFSTIIVGLVYLPGSLGYLLASIFGGRWTDTIMAREARKAGRYDEKGKLQYRPEDRMRENAWIAAALYPVAMIWYGWTVQRGVFWAAPLIANFFFGIGSMLIFAMSTTMLTEFMPRKASSGVAVSNFVRNTCSCIATIVAQPLIEAIGNGWLFTGFGVIAMCSSVIIWVMRKYGRAWRVKMVAELG